MLISEGFPKFHWGQLTPTPLRQLRPWREKGEKVTVHCHGPEKGVQLFTGSH
jgi:hypothetical protein